MAMCSTIDTLFMVITQFVIGDDAALSAMLAMDVPLNMSFRSSLANAVDLPAILIQFG